MDNNRDSSWELLVRYNPSESLQKHALSVEGVMRHFAEKKGHDPLFWGNVGLLHDLDWEKFPQEHCHKTGEILAEEGYSSPFIRAVQSHGWGIVTEVEPQHFMEKVLFATDELTGLITATALVRPSKSLLDMKIKSVKKKWKDKGFSAGVDRSIIQKGCDLMEMPLDEVMTETLEAMQKIAPELGLAGEN